MTFVGQSSVVMVEHPVHGKTRVTRDPAAPLLAVGDAVILEGVTVLPGGVVRVAGWRLAAAPTPTRDEPPTMLDVGLLSTGPVGPVERQTLEVFLDALLAGAPEAPAAQDVPPGVRNLEAMTPLVEPIERLFGGPLTLLRTLAAACDRSLEVRAAWERVGPTLACAPRDAALDDVAERLEALGFAPFATDEGRVYHGVVYDRASGARGVATLWLEGDSEITWAASSFDGWFAQVLRDAHPPSLVRVLLGQLRLPETATNVNRESPPAWFADVA